MIDSLAISDDLTSSCSSFVEADWAHAQNGFMRRHVIAHRAGVVDQQYLDETGEDPTLLGRRIAV